MNRELYHELANVITIAQGNARRVIKYLENTTPEELPAAREKAAKVLVSLEKIMALLKTEREKINVDKPKEAA